MHRNQLHFYIPTMREEREIKEWIPFTIVPKTQRYLGIRDKGSVLRKLQNTHEIEKDTKNGENVPCS